MNNSEKTLKNSIISVFGQICNLALQFINRAVFVIFLDIELLGYQSLFGNVFAFLSLAELGIGNIIAFHLYKEIVTHNHDEIGRLMCLFKYLYRIVAFVVLIVGIICYFLLPFFVKNENVSWNYVHTIYFMQLGSVILGYFLSYKRTLFIATQQEYKCVSIDVIVSTLVQVIQLTTLAVFHNYFLYLFIQLSTSIVANIIISIKCNREFPYIKNHYTITKEFIKKRNLFKDFRDILFHKICYAIYGGTDNIIISAFCGVRMVALYSNYVMLQMGVMSVLFYRLLNPVQATLGNIVYSDKPIKDQWEQFNILDVFSFFFATYIGLGFLLFFQPAIEVWMGNDYLLSDLFVIIFAIYIYLGAVFEIVYKYRSVFGDYRQDRFCMLLSAVLNIAVSIPGAIYFGIEGVLAGTVCAFLPIAYGRIRFVVQNYFHKSMYKYFLRHTLLFFVFCVQGAVAYQVCHELSVSFMGFLQRGLIWLVLPLIVNCMIYWNNPYFKMMYRYLKKFIGIILSKTRLL